jgi:ketosteroid isomerase-like protein
MGDHARATSATGHDQLLTLEDAWAGALVSNDAERIAGFMADDWVLVSEGGVTPKEHFPSVVRSGELTHSAMTRVSEARIRLYGDAAVFTARVTNTAHHLGRPFDADEWTTDVFVRRNEDWVCVLSQITSAARAP